MAGIRNSARRQPTVKNAATEPATADGVSLNQFIAAAVAEEVVSLRASDTFLAERAGRALLARSPACATAGRVSERFVLDASVALAWFLDESPSNP